LTRLGVLGWPVAHSRSPQMHNAALEAAGLSSWRYQLLPVPPELLVETVQALPAMGFRGVNVTIPHKETALALASEPTPRARQIGAANVLMFAEHGTVGADNTDALALSESLPVEMSGKTALVLGAGGSARAAVWALIEAGAEVRVWNRTPDRARQLCTELGGVPVAAAEPANLLVNCTPVGLDVKESEFKQLPLAADDLRGYDCVVDLVYGDADTPLVRAARARLVPVVDGLEVLVRQGALSFELFTGREAPLEVMRMAARR
jgi:shikimate dehydrogenase